MFIRGGDSVSVRPQNTLCARKAALSPPFSVWSLHSACGDGVLDHDRDGLSLYLMMSLQYNLCSSLK